MAKLKSCPYCGGMHRKVRAFKRCENTHRPQKWKKSPK